MSQLDTNLQNDDSPTVAGFVGIALAVLGIFFTFIYFASP